MINKCPVSFLKKLFKRDKKITFLSRLPHGDIIQPIEEVNIFDREWKNHSIDLFKKKALGPAEPGQIVGLHRCPGIVSVIKTGFIIKAHRDFYVESTGDSAKLKGKLNFESKEKGIVNIVDTGLMETDLKDYPFKPKGALPVILKIDTMWSVKCPKDIMFLFLPIPYSDDVRFSALPGVLDPLLGDSIKVFFWWFVPFKKDIIKKGTPLMQLIPISRKRIYDTWSIDSSDPDFFQKTDTISYIRASTRICNYSNLQKSSEKLFHGTK